METALTLQAMPVPPIKRDQDRLLQALAESGHIPGTGLGLSIVDEIVRAHGGWVTVESTAGQGGVFTLWLRSVS